MHVNILYFQYLHILVQSIHQPLSHVDDTGVHTRSVPVLITELSPGHCSNVMPSPVIWMTTYKRTSTVSISKSHTTFWILHSIQSKTLKRKKADYFQNFNNVHVKSAGCPKKTPLCFNRFKQHGGVFLGLPVIVKCSFTR